MALGRAAGIVARCLVVLYAPFSWRASLAEFCQKREWNWELLMVFHWGMLAWLHICVVETFPHHLFTFLLCKKKGYKSFQHDHVASHAQKTSYHTNLLMEKALIKVPTKDHCHHTANRWYKGIYTRCNWLIWPYVSQSYSTLLSNMQHTIWVIDSYTACELLALPDWNLHTVHYCCRYVHFITTPCHQSDSKQWNVAKYKSAPLHKISLK